MHNVPSPVFFSLKEKRGRRSVNLSALELIDQRAELTIGEGKFGNINAAQAFKLFNQFTGSINRILVMLSHLKKFQSYLDQGFLKFDTNAAELPMHQVVQR
ncbi:MAG: hypothetical protein ABJP25_22325 [Sneathiella sp.]